MADGPRTSPFGLAVVGDRVECTGCQRLNYETVLYNRGLPYCSTCGKEVQSGVSFCSNCGAPVGQAQAPTFVGHAPPVHPAPPAPSKPPLTLPLTLLALLVGVIYLFMGTISLGVRSGYVAALVVAQLALFGVGILSLASVYGLVKRKRWTKKEGMANAVAAILVGVLFAVLANALFLALAALGIVLGGALLYYLGRPASQQFLIG